ncbi:Cyclic nucleotide-binding protein:Bacterial regulatory protein, Crp [Dehalobacter sp. UNSWDHB]|jgi:cAMP-binding proteins - catabolite gene activator and regulatory subunit of cAMP-dependent protein kinases|uniref:Crp/Fnr family transcriptional regulator n=1 Tax=unclassified Dehalobacter TaxID=2635733 RepID=UPI00028B7C4D|nr:MULTISPECIES: Crp/Fnr family transcriptional regulator [unclassified Dehalobacter]AFV03152.1 Cyclic nucleotide-binding:Bacterial regulatory protein, Crp [Dehalobacter sp. DCA]AFV06142.1 Cyclic nucleotide-binding:Bacterial regulatory protein, Crp [Dehalobacter sp. CF]EQB21111.1 Cyclic nucleotide-binding protein:Bacterial regulatory protein, Crp [Dehalobacter sp. UNSWDHB]
MERLSSEDFSFIFKRDNIPQALINKGRVLHIAKNTIIASPGDLPNELYYVCKGSLHAYEYSTKGNERIVAILDEGSIFWETCFLFQVPIPYYFKTTKDSHLISIKHSDLINLLASDLSVTLSILQSLTKKLLTQMYLTDELLHYNTEWRICNLLIVIAENYGLEEDAKVKLDTNITQQFMSNLLGINRVTTVRVIQKLKRMKLIDFTNGYYYIRDIQRLEDYQAGLLFSS